MFKKPIVWLLGALALVAAYVMFVAPKIAEYSANQTFQTNLTELQTRSKALSDKLAEPAGQALVAASKDKIIEIQALQREYIAAYPDEVKTSTLIDKVMTAIVEARLVLDKQDDDMRTKVQDFNVAMSVMVMRNPQLFAKRQDEVAAVVEGTLKAYLPIANLQRLLDTVDSSANSLLLRSGKGANPTPEDLVEARRTVVKTILDRVAVARNRAPQN